MANRTMDEDCRQPEEAASATATADVAATTTAGPSKRRVSRTSSTGGVRRILEKRFQSISHLMNEKDEVKTAKQWSQRLQNHLQAKRIAGPSTHEKQIRTRTMDTMYDGDASNPNLLLEEDTRPPRDTNYASSSRLENSISADIIAAGWLSPKKSSSRNNNNSSANNGSYSHLESSYNDSSKQQKNLNRHLQSKSKSPSRRDNNNDSRSILFPPPPLEADPTGNTTSSGLRPDVGSSSTFSGANEFLNMSSGPLNTNSLSLLDSSMNASKEFTVVRQAQEPPPPPQQSSSSSPKQYTPPKSRLSIFGKGRPVVAPKLAKQLTDFRLRRQGKGPKPEVEEDGNFSVTTDRMSGTSGHQEEEEEGEAEEAGAKHVRKAEASGEFHNVEKVLNSQKQRMVLKNEIEWRRTKFKAKLAGVSSSSNTNNSSSNTSKTKETTTTTTTATGTALASAFAKERKQTINKEEDEMSMPSLTLEAVRPTGRAPMRSKSSGSAAARRNMLGESMDSAAFMSSMFDDDDDAYFAMATAGKMSATTTTTTTTTITAKQDPPSSPSKKGPSKPGILTRSRTTSDLEKSTSMFHYRETSTVVPNVAPQTAAAEATYTNRSERTIGSSKSAGSSAGDATAVSSGSGGSNRSPPPQNRPPPQNTSNHKKSKAKRRATVAAVDGEQSFQIRDGEFVWGRVKKGGKNNNNKSISFATTFSSKPDKDTTHMFHQSFALESLVSSSSGTTKTKSHGCSMPINTAEMPNLFDMSSSLLSTVDENSQHNAGIRPRRRNSLPSGSTHDSVVPKDALFSPTLSKPKLTKAKSIERTPKSMTPRRSRRRHSVQGAPDLEESFAQLCVNLDIADEPTATKSRSSASVATSTTASSLRSKKAGGSLAGSEQLGTEEEEQIMAATKMFGLAPPPSDATTPRRRTSISAPSVPEHQPDKTVEKIRARRRESVRASVRQEKSKLRMKDNSESAISSRRMKDNSETALSTRRKERKSRRDKTSEALKRSMTADAATPPIKEERRQRSRTPNGTRRKSTDEMMNDESRKKHTGRTSTPNAPRRMRRASVQAEPGSATPKTPRASARKSSSEGLYKPRPRDRSPKASFGIISPTTPRMRALNRGMDDESQAGRSRSTMDDGSQMGRSNRRSGRPINRQTSVDESESKSEEMSDDDSDYEPTPKPAAPPSLPVLSRPGGGRARASMLSPRRNTGKHRRSKSDYNNRRDEEADLPDLVSPPPSAERRKTRNRRHTMHEALKESGEISPSLQGIVHKSSAGDASVAAGSEALQSPEQDVASKAKKAIDNKKLVAELCRSPNKANRFRRRKTATEETQKEDALTSTKSPSRSSRKSRRARSGDEVGKADPTKAPKTPSLRRRKTEVNNNVETTPIRSRLRRVKTADNPLPSINLEAEMEKVPAPETKEADSLKGDEPELDGNASNRFMLKGISF